MFVCNDSTSILDYTSICDLSPDCVDGSDENDCRELFYTLWNLFLQLDCFCILNCQETKSEEKKVTVLEIYLFMIVIHCKDIGSFFSCLDFLPWLSKWYMLLIAAITRSNCLLVYLSNNLTLNSSLLRGTGHFVRFTDQ